MHFKSSTNRAPRQFTNGESGEQRELRLEMQVLADVGLLGLPNAGKSTLIRQVTSAQSKVGEYPFTTLYPHLGVAYPNSDRSFIIADIPGLIEGAAQGAGLGIQFLKHLSRTRLLLHLVDIASCDDMDKFLNDIDTVVNELKAYGKNLPELQRWLVLNKIDALDSESVVRFKDAIQTRYGSDTPCYCISAVSGDGCQELMHAIQMHLFREDDDNIENTKEHEKG